VFRQYPEKGIVEGMNEGEEIIMNDEILYEIKKSLGDVIDTLDNDFSLDKVNSLATELKAIYYDLDTFRIQLNEGRR
jgi:hypothetical protein